MELTENTQLKLFLILRKRNVYTYICIYTCMCIRIDDNNNMPSNCDDVEFWFNSNWHSTQLHLKTRHEYNYMHSHIIHILYIHTCIYVCISICSYIHICIYKYKCTQLPANQNKIRKISNIPPTSNMTLLGEVN